MEEKNENRQAVVMEGMYKGMTGKLEEVRHSFSQELQYSAVQQASAFDSLAGQIRQGMESMLAEIRYLSQQSSAIYDFNQKDRATVKGALLEAIHACTEQVRACTERIDALEARLEDMPAAAPAGEPVPAEEAPAEEASAAEEAPAEEPVPAEETVQPEESAQPAAEEAQPVFFDEGFDYDVLAEKIASILPEPDYDELVDKIVAAIPPADPDAVAAAVIAAVPQTDENAIADKVAEAVPLVDYDIVAERVAAVMENEFDVTVDENGIAKIAAAVTDAIDHEKIARRVAELLRGQGAIVVAPAAAIAEAKEEAEAPAEAEEAPAEGPAFAEPEEAAAEPVAEEETEEAPPAQEEPKEAEEELAAAVAPAAEAPVIVAAPVVAAPAETELTTRFKRSFKAKMIESTEEIKNFYFDLKNELLSYARVSSQINWSNDRFAWGRETVAKIGIRGKTLCLYVALNPDEYPSSVYHQTFAGDTKMYEKTPMMVKIKSAVGVKRAIRLIEMVMENIGAVKEEGFIPIDFADEFAFRSEEQLLAEGLIKTSVMEKPDLDF